VPADIEIHSIKEEIWGENKLAVEMIETGISWRASTPPDN